MGSYLRQLVVLSSVAAKRQKFELLAASCLMPLSLGLSEPALAQTFTFPAGNYPTGIGVNNPGAPTNVILDPGVQVFVTPGTINQAVAVSTGTAAGTGAPATFIMPDAVMVALPRMGWRNSAETKSPPEMVTAALFAVRVAGRPEPGPVPVLRATA